jgi:hypothetical protein
MLGFMLLLCGLFQLRYPNPIQEVFLERHWDDATIARHHCDIRKAELEAQDLICTTERRPRILYWYISNVS